MKVSQVNQQIYKQFKTAAPMMAVMMAVVLAETGGGGVSCDSRVALAPTGKVNAIITHISGKRRKV